MKSRLIFLMTIVIGYLSTGIRGDGHLTRPSATNVSITRDGCGTTKLCLGEDGCDPAGNTLCTFVSAQLVNTTNVDVAFELFGSAEGYIAVVLTTDLTQGGGVVFVCSRDPFTATRNFLFRTASQNGTDGSITLTNTPRVDSITYNFNGSLNGTFHQCSFTTRNLTSAFTRASLGFQVSVVSGIVNADGTFMAPSGRLFNTSGIVDIANPMALSMTASPNATNATTAMPATAVTTVAMAMTTDGCPSLMHPLTQGITILVSILALRLL
ncbi:uncharacterized protein LOC134466243 [Engraulis encrasicolus]|uniref:uncharacterized protein LOC134466243 n=1 Tax=Engraulis encrasicolus TaxID=184585 RepID=UPI002FCF9A29